MSKIVNKLFLFCFICIPSICCSSVVESIDINTVKSSNRSLFLKNLPNAVKVESELVRRGFGNEKALKAIHINTWHESKWNPNVKSGNFVGIFQIGGNGTMGHGTTVTQRKSITFSVNLISSRSDFITWYKKHKYKDTTLKQATEEFAKNVLRCHRSHIASRGATANRWGIRN